MKNTQFRVLPVPRGAAYLLKSKRGSYLVDGGAPDCLLPEMLAERKSGKLRAAICTSINTHRAGGILDLMEKPNHIAEYWFPDSVEILTEMARRFTGDWEDWLNLLGTNTLATGICHTPWGNVVSPMPSESPLRRLEGAAILIGLAMTASLDWSPYAGMSRDACLGRGRGGLVTFLGWTLSILSERIAPRWGTTQRLVSRVLVALGKGLVSGGGPEDLILFCGKLLLADAERMDKTGGRAKIVQLLATSAIISAMLAKNGAKARFFSHTSKPTNHLVPRHPIKCLNGVERTLLEDLPPCAMPLDIFRQASHHGAQKDGLTFQYGDAGCGVLFCGDTRLSFIDRQKPLVLDRPTVVTAPRQGYCSGDHAYGRIISHAPDQDIWVRSHASYARKISDYYKKMPVKCCLGNCVNLTFQEILLDFDQGRWIRTAGGGCACN